MATFTQLEASSGSLLTEGFLEMRAQKEHSIAGNNGYKVVAPARQFQTWDKLMEGEVYEVGSAGAGKLVDGTTPIRSQSGGTSLIV